MVKKRGSIFSTLKNNPLLTLISLILLALAIFISKISIKKTLSIQGIEPARDLILTNFGPYNFPFNYLYLWGPVILIFTYFLYPVFCKREKIFYYLNMFSFLYLTRAFSILLTNLKNPSDAIFPKMIYFPSESNDLLFSGHVGLAFLSYLMFKEDSKIMKTIALIATFLMVITVLALHVHYSIDVFAAFFIVYGIYKIGGAIKIYYDKK